MKNPLRIGFTLLALSVLGACAQTKEKAAPATLNTVCVMSDEALDAKSPTSDYMGGKVGFCCEKCQAKWNALDAAGKKAAFDAKVPAKK